jgi:hypothetical protein
VSPVGRHASKRTLKVVHCYTTNSSIKKSDNDDADPLKYFSALDASWSFFCNIFYFCYVLDVVHRLVRTVIGVLFNPNR